MIAPRHAPARLTLAPLQGLTEAPFRALLRHTGGVGAFVTPFVRVSHRVTSAAAIFKEMPELTHPRLVDQRNPTFLQLLGSEPGPVAESAALAVKLGAPGVDLNFGCPDKRVNRHHGGAAMLLHPESIERVVRAVRDALPADLPVSAKVRLGWDSSDLLAEIASAVQSGGASWVTVHGRTREQRYTGQADWSAIGRVRESVSIPVVANGDIDSPLALRRCQLESGCKHFMIGRGVLVVPELFLLLSDPKQTPWSPARRGALLLHYLRERERWAMSDYAALGRVKGLAVYLAQGHRDLRALFQVFKWASSVHEAKRVLIEWLREQPDGSRWCNSSSLRVEATRRP